MSETTENERLRAELADARYALEVSKGCCLRAEEVEAENEQLRKALEQARDDWRTTKREVAPAGFLPKQEPTVTYHESHSVVIGEPVGAVVAEPEPKPKRWRHRNGGTYTMVGHALAQTTKGVSDYDAVVVYRDEEDGLLWVRPVEEFNDGRFEPAALASCDENRDGEDRVSGLRSEGLPARPASAGDALIEPLNTLVTELRDFVDENYAEVLMIHRPRFNKIVGRLAAAASALSSSKARIEELEKDLADTRYALDISKGCCLRAEAAESRLSKMEKALEEIAAQETERSNATVRRMAGIARSALRSKGETEDGQ